MLLGSQKVIKRCLTDGKTSESITGDMCSLIDSKFEIKCRARGNVSSFDPLPMPINASRDKQDSHKFYYTSIKERRRKA